MQCRTHGIARPRDRHNLLDDVRKGVCDIHCLCANVGADLVAIDDEWNVWFGRRALVDAGLPS